MAWVYIAVYLLYLVVIGLRHARSGADQRTQPHARRCQSVGSKTDEGLRVVRSGNVPCRRAGRRTFDVIGASSTAVAAYRLERRDLVAGLDRMAMHTNTFFSTVVPIQSERGHHVIDTGPYRHVRHPGYVAMIGSILATPLVFGSLWGLIPGGAGSWYHWGAHRRGRSHAASRIARLCRVCPASALPAAAGNLVITERS